MSFFFLKKNTPSCSFIVMNVKTVLVFIKSICVRPFQFFKRKKNKKILIFIIWTCIVYAEFPVGPWSSWSPCSVTCGKGAMTRTREGTVSDDFTQKYPLTVNKDCYEDPCEGMRKYFLSGSKY